MSNDNYNYKSPINIHEPLARHIVHRPNDLRHGLLHLLGLLLTPHRSEDPTHELRAPDLVQAAPELGLEQYHQHQQAHTDDLVQQPRDRIEAQEAGDPGHDQHHGDALEQGIRTGVDNQLDDVVYQNGQYGHVDDIVPIRVFKEIGKQRADGSKHLPNLHHVCHPRHYIPIHVYYNTKSVKIQRVFEN